MIVTALKVYVIDIQAFFCRDTIALCDEQISQRAQSSLNTVNRNSNMPENKQTDGQKGVNNPFTSVLSRICE